jgi:hypothetical protein
MDEALRAFHQAAAEENRQRPERRRYSSTLQHRRRRRGAVGPVLDAEHPAAGDYDGDGRADYTFYTAFKGV